MQEKDYKKIIILLLCITAAFFLFAVCVYLKIVKVNQLIVKRYPVQGIDVHLGYLGYDADRKSAYIPNYEVASAYQLALKKSGLYTKIVTESINNQINVLKICDN